MPVERDLAFVVGETVGAAEIVKAAESAERSLIAKVGVFDIYRGQGLPEAAKSIAIHVTLQPRERTLTEADIEAAISKIVSEVSRKTGATLRS
jgi:phenylalanyl-tRNA synthetase beta chain